jgi:predicted transcriptional regulator
MPGQMAADQCTVAAQITKTDRAALREIAKREDRTVSWLLRRGVRYVLAQEEGTAPTAEGGPEDARAGATSDRA